jgi:hypothetical protein
MQYSLSYLINDLQDLQDLQDLHDNQFLFPIQQNKISHQPIIIHPVILSCRITLYIPPHPR